MGNLRQLDKNEWYDVYRIFFPDASRSELDREWDIFQKFKAEHLRKRKVQ
jgi:hypothetical protein